MRGARASASSLSGSRRPSERGVRRPQGVRSSACFAPAQQAHEKGVCRGAQPLAGSLRVSLRYNSSPFLARKGARGWSKGLFSPAGVAIENVLTG